MTSPSVATLKSQVDAAATGADATTEIGECPAAGTVSRVAYVPSATITGADTNTRTLTLKNKGQTGVGTTTVASLALTNGVNAPAADAKTVTLSGTPANLTVAAGDVLELQSVHAGTGLADPGGQVIVEITRGDTSA